MGAPGCPPQHLGMCIRVVPAQGDGIQHAWVHLNPCALRIKGYAVRGVAIMAAAALGLFAPTRTTRSR